MTNARIVSCCAALLVVACNQGDNALFGPDAPPVSDDGGSSGAPSSGGSAPTAGAPSGMAGGGTGGALGGGAAPAPLGGEAGHVAAGAMNPPDPPDAAGAAGADNGAAGSGEPPEPVCGNGVIEAGEQCDGGSDETGCDGECRVVCSDHGAETVESDEHHCYKGYTDEKDFDGAKQACAKLGGHLATLSSAAENKLMIELVRESKFVGGFEDVALSSEGTGKYQWVTGEPFDYTNWAQREPDRAASRCGSGISASRCYEHCVAVTGDGTWIDQRCDRSDGYVCEWEPPGTK